MNKGFTLLELIVVIVILGILATLGFTQYSKQVESTRLAEAKTRIGLMRQLATEYYWKNGSLDGIQNSDVGVDDICTTFNFYRYQVWGSGSTSRYLLATRCTSGGKTPNASTTYEFFLNFAPATGVESWHCRDSDGVSPCFSYPP